MLLTNTIGIIIILLNLAGLAYLLLIGFRNITGNRKKKLLKIKIHAQKAKSKNIDKKADIDKKIIKNKDDLLDDLDLSDFDDLNLDDFD